MYHGSVNFLIFCWSCYLFSRSPHTEESMERLVIQMKEMLSQQQEQQKGLKNSTLSNKNEKSNLGNDSNISSRASFSSGGTAEAEVARMTAATSAAVIAATEANEKDYIKTQKLQAELLLVQQQLTQKSRELAEKEETLLFDMRDFKILQKVEKEKANAKIYLSSIDNLASLKPPNEEFISKLREQSRAVSAITIKSQLVQGTKCDLMNQFFFKNYIYGSIFFHFFHYFGF